jgi:hypothetical protein
MQSTFAALEGDQFLTFVILFYPPMPVTTFPPRQTTPITSSEPGSRLYHTRILLLIEFHLVLTFFLPSYSITAFFGIRFNKELRFYLPGLYIFAPVSVRVQHTIELTHIVGPACLMAPFPGKMSDDELQEALTEHKDSRLLLPARLTPGFWGKVPVESFCRRYELPEEIASVLTQMMVKDAHGLSRVYLRDLRDNGLAHRSINMLRLAVIRFSSESRP